MFLVTFHTLQTTAQETLHARPIKQTGRIFIRRAKSILCCSL